MCPWLNLESVDRMNWTRRLFSSLPSDAFSGPTIRTLIALYDNYVADVAVNEVVTNHERLEDTAFLHAVMETSVMKQAHQFLVSKGKLITTQVQN